MVSEYTRTVLHWDQKHQDDHP